MSLRPGASEPLACCDVSLNCAWFAQSTANNGSQKHKEATVTSCVTGLLSESCIAIFSLLGRKPESAPPLSGSDKFRSYQSCTVCAQHGADKLQCRAGNA